MFDGDPNLENWVRNLGSLSKKFAAKNIKIWGKFQKKTSQLDRK